ncbi:MAG TPA: hypothetical protein V6D21_23750 [Candidatus Obscuribacterales bacterium]
MAIGLNVDVDVLGIADRIASAVDGGSDRSGFVKGLMESAVHQAGDQYNVMVFNLGNDYERSFNGIQFFATAPYQNLTFGIWIFEDGDFTNKGDGGWINWAFSGVFDRHDKYVKFKKRF